MKYRRTVGGIAALATVAGGSVLVALSAPTYAGSVTPSFPTKSADSSVNVIRGNGSKVTGIIAKDRSIKRPSNVKKGNAVDAAKAHVNRYASALGVNASELTPKTATNVPDGVTVKFTQRKNGLEVYGGEFVAALDTDGNLQALLGEGAKGAVATVKNALSRRDGIAVAKAWVAKQAKLPSAKLRAEFKGSKIYDASLFSVPGASGAAREVLVYHVSSLDHAVEYEVLVDKGFKAVALGVSLVHEELNRKVCDIENKDVGDLEGGACDGEKNTYTRVEGKSATGQADVDRVYDNLGISAQWYASYINLDLTKLIGDPKAPGGSALRASVRVCASKVQQGCPLENAFWSGGTNQMYFGEGYTYLDTTGHELTHGVTNNTSNLKYIYQSGAMNESMSDVFGAIIDIAANPDKKGTPAEWVHGDEKQGDQASFRSLKDPTQSSYPQPDKMTSEHWFVEETDQWTDSGGVHYNSGVGNKTGYLIANGDSFNGYQIRGLGLAKTFKIYWTAQNLLTSGSDYKDLYNVLPLACKKNIGRTGAFVTADDCAQVDKAVRATELYKDASKDPKPVATPYCESGSVKRSYFQGFESADTAKDWKLGGNAGLTKADFEYDYVNSGKDAAFLYTDGTADWQSGALEQTTGVKVPSSGWLRVDYATTFGQQRPSSGTTAALQYNDGSGWKSATSLPGVNKGNWTGNSFGWSSAKYNLSSLAGKTVKFRFTQSGGPADGTFSLLNVDNFKIYTCG